MDLLHFSEHGSGPAAVLLHGFCESAEVWAAQVAQLQDSFHIITIDLPGFGKSAHLDSDLSMESMAYEVLRVLDRLHISSACLLGHSMGGYVSLAFIEAYPDRITGLALIHSTAYADDHQRREIRNKTIDFVQRRGVDVYLETFIPSLFYDKTMMSLQIDELQKIASKTPQSSITSGLQAMRDRRDRSTLLNEIKIPVLFVAGKEDALIPMSGILELAQRPADAILHLLADIGHISLLETPDRLSMILRNFISYQHS